MPNFFYQFHFYLFGLIAIAAALTFVTRRSPVAAALWLVVTMFALSALYVMLDAHFVGAVQVLLYAGAIMVVFLFVIMLLNLGRPDELSDLRGRSGWIAAGLVGLMLLAQLGVIVRAKFPRPLTLAQFDVAGEVRAKGSAGAIADSLFREHLLAFELTSVLLLVAIIGALVIGKRRAA
jgi:NADH-quinone oxidoreductase subunit J